MKNINTISFVNICLLSKGITVNYGEKKTN